MTPYSETTSVPLRRDPYLIGVAGGTASGKVIYASRVKSLKVRI